MSQSTTYSVIRVDFPADLSASSRVHLISSLSRWCDKYTGRVLSNADNSFVITDLDGQSIGGFTHICEVFNCVYSIRLISRRFFDSLFENPAFSAVG